MDVSVCIVNSVACFFAAVGGCLVLGRMLHFHSLRDLRVRADAISAVSVRWCCDTR